MYSPALDSDLSMPKGGGRFRGSKSNNLRWGNGNLSLFENIEGHLCTLIREWGQRGKFIFVAMAWFTKSKILKSLLDAQRRGCLVAVLVTKDDVWRKDLWNQGDPKFRDGRRRAAEISLRSYTSFLWYDTKDFLRIIEKYAPGIVYGTDPECTIWKENYDYAPIGPQPPEGKTTPFRCFGNYKDHARMHNKFIVFGYRDEFTLRPQAVWKGSFNATGTATKSKESVEYINNPEPAKANLYEFCSMYLKSEPFAWTSVEARPAFYKAKQSMPDIRPLKGIPTIEEIIADGWEKCGYYEDWWAPMDQVRYIVDALLRDKETK